MKNLTKIFMAVCVALFAFACTTDPTEDRGVNLGADGQTTLTLSLEEVRTHINGKAGEQYPLYWSAGDKIAVNGVASDPLSEEFHGSTSATFTVGNLAYPCNIVYPAPAEGVTAAEGLQAVTFLATQEYAAGTFAEGSTPMYAQVAQEGDGINLQHLAGVLRVAPKGNGEVLTSMTLTVENGKIAGNFDLDCTTGVLTAHEDAVNTITVTFGEGLTLGAEAAPFYVAVPAGEYGVFALRLNTATDSMLIRFDSEGEKAIKAGTIREFAEFTFAPNAATSDVFEIYDEASLRRFAANANAFYPYTSAKVVATIDMTGKSWTPIEGFEYAFDGGSDKGHEIKGLTAPLFGITAATEIKNVKLTNVNINVGGSVAGALANVIDNTEAAVSNCSVSGNLTVNATNPAPYVNSNNEVRVYYAGMIGFSSSTATFTNLTSNVVLTVQGTYAHENTNNVWLAGLISDHAGKLTNSTNLGKVIFNGEALEDAKGTKTTVVIGGLATTVRKGITNCVNGSSENTTQESGSITVDNKIVGSIGIGGLAAYVFSTNSNCRNYGSITLNGETSTCYIGGLAWRTGGASTFTNCENHGNITWNGTVTSYNYSGGFMSKSYNNTTCNQCKNYGNLTLSSDSYTESTISLGGFYGRREDDVLDTWNECHNYGDITFAGTSNHYFQAGGFVGAYSQNTKLKVMGDCVNEGDIIVGGTIEGTILLGGLCGDFTAGVNGDSVGKMINKGDINCSAVSNVAADGTPIQIGGFAGRMKYSITGTNLKVVNDGGDITCTATTKNGTPIYVGGLTGSFNAENIYLGNARVICNIVAKDCDNVGLGTGSQRADIARAQLRACSVGGSIWRKGDNEAVTLTASNYHNYFYGSPVDASIITGAYPNGDTGGFITNVNGSPVYGPGEGINSLEEFIAFANSANGSSKSVELNVDIDLSGKEFNTIENYSGKFNGNDHKINGLTTPLFGTLKGSVCNVHLTNVNITDNSRSAIGALACNVNNTTAEIINCSAEGKLTVNGEYSASTLDIGGIIGLSTTTNEISSLVNKVTLNIAGTRNATKTYIAGVIARTSGNIDNCTNLGNINVEGTTKVQYLAGVVCQSLDITNCTNGSQSQKQTLGAINIAGTATQLMTGGVACTTGLNPKAMRYCKNYGAITIGGSSSAQFRLGGVNSNGEVVKGPIEYCENHGNITISHQNSGTANAQIGGVATMISTGIKPLANCANYGTIDIQSAATFPKDLLLGGIINVFDQPIAYSDLSNYGDITVSATISGTTGVGGISARFKTQGTAGSLTGNFYNKGAITVNGTHKNLTFVGGIFGYDYASSVVYNASGATFENAGAITFGGTVAADKYLHVGGILGACFANCDAAALINTGNIYVTKEASFTAGYENVGGIFGARGGESAAGVVSNARCFCEIAAINCTKVGMITNRLIGDKPLTNCHVGGRIATTIDEVSTGPIWGDLDDWTFIEFIYGEPISIEEATAGKLGWLQKSIDDTPIGADGAPIVEQ